MIPSTYMIADVYPVIKLKEKSISYRNILCPKQYQWHRWAMLACVVNTYT